MSIINDALKKTEESIQKKAGKFSYAERKKPAIKVYAAYLLIFVIILFLGVLIFTVIKRKIEPPPVIEPPKTHTITLPPQQAAAPEPEPAEPVQAAAATEQAKPEKEFVLNGIFFSDDNGYALINNRIVRENDSVDGANVEKITAHSVELSSEGKIITLSTSR